MACKFYIHTVLVLLVAFRPSICLFRYFTKGKPGVSLIVGLGQHEKCIKNLGCFNIGPPFFHPINRPFSFLPKNREYIHTKFFLYTNINPWKKDILIPDKKETIGQSDFEAKWPTKIIIHGFLDSLFLSTWMDKIKDAFLSIGDYNVILVTWFFGATSLYGQATANTRVVGAEVALLIKCLQEMKGVNPETIHIIGHSLGAHIAGYAGERIKNLGRITGLDPAGPYFQEIPPEVRLDPTDAIFVDVIHTDAGKTILHGFGTDEVIGDMDFFPNGGVKQPGCGTLAEVKTAKTKYEVLMKTFACSHNRAPGLFVASIIKRNCFVGVACPNYHDYLSGRCVCDYNTQCAFMGLDADQYIKDGQRVFYLKTGSHFPYCVYQYQIGIWYEGDPFQNPVAEEHFEISFQSENGYKLISTLSDKDENYGHDGYKTFLVTSDEPLQPIQETLFQWRRNGLVSHSERKDDGPKAIYVKYLKIVPINISYRRSSEDIWCGNSNLPIYPDKYVLISPVDCHSILHPNYSTANKTQS